MDAITVFGALAASEGANAMAILAPVEQLPGHLTWTSKDINTADQTFAGSEHATVQPSLLQTWLVAGACVVAWKEATFEGTKKNDDDETREPSNKERTDKDPS